MSRIRTIKPEFPQSETVGKLSRDARLLFVQLWTIVDDEGRARASSRMLASLLYPYDDDAPRLIAGWLGELEANGCLRRYEVDGSHFLDLPNWLKHQKIDHKAKSKLPEFRETIAGVREPSRSLAPDLGPRTKDLGPRTTQEGAREASEEGEGDPLDIPASLDRQPYSAAFEGLWLSYKPIAPKTATKIDASRAFERLNAVDKERCAAGLLAYVGEMRLERQKRVDAPVKHLATFINRRAWEPYLEQPAKMNGNGNGHAPIDWVERAEQYHRLGDRWAPFWEPYEMVPAEYRHLFGDLFAGAAT